MDQDDLLVRPSKAIAYLFDPDLKSKDIIKHCFVRIGSAVVPCTTFPTSFARLTSCKAIFLPTWIKGFLGIKDTMVDVEYVENIGITGLVEIEIINVPLLSSTFEEGALLEVIEGSKMNLVDGLIFPVILDCQELYLRVCRISPAEHKSIKIVNAPTTSGWTIVDEIFREVYKDDMARFLLYAKASQLKLAVKEAEWTFIYTLTAKDKRVLTAFIGGLAQEMNTSPFILEFAKIGDDEEIEVDPLPLLQSLKQKCLGKQLIVIPYISKYQNESTLKKLHDFFLELHRNSPQTRILFVDFDYPEKIMRALKRTGHFHIEDFQPNPLSQDSQKVYLASRLPHTIKAEVLDEFSWKLNGLELKELDLIVDSIQSERNEKDLKESLRKAFDQIGTSRSPQYLISLGRNLSSWHEIKGYEGAKQKIQDFLYGPWKEPKLYSNFGLKRSPGILLHGPSGCGKTAMVQAIANDGVFNVLELDMTALKSKYLGETEERLRHAFNTARQSSPCVLYIDHIDCLGKRRGLADDDGAGAGPEERLLSTMLNELDGIEELGQVTVIGCTNNIDALDSALKRPGRLDLHIEVGLPDEQDRLEIIQHWLEKFNPDQDPSGIARFTDGMSCAEIVQLFHLAGRRSIIDNPSKPVVKLDFLEELHA